MTTAKPVSKAKTKSKADKPLTYAEQVRQMDENGHELRREMVASARALPFFAQGTKIAQMALLFAAGTAVITAFIASLG